LTSRDPLSEDDFEPRYVDVPRRRRAHIAAERNLKWGLAMLLVALGVFGAAVIIAGPRALVPLLVCMITFTVLWVLARLRVFHQRNGVFFAAAVVCLVGAVVPLIESGYIALARVARAPQPGTSPSPAAAQSAVAPAPGDEPAPVMEKVAEPLVTGLSRELDAPSLVEAFRVQTPTDSTANLVRIIETARVDVGRKPYLLHAGDTFILESVKNGQVTFRANELRLTVPDSITELMIGKPEPTVASTPPSGEKPAPIAPPRAVESHVSDHDSDLIARSQAEAVRRYPKIGVKGTPENALFVEHFKQLKEERPDFFDDDEWPIYLADILAKEHGWQRATMITDETGPAEGADPEPPATEELQ
jgi:hypothetical protein